jgi:hypothetical protein
MAVSLNGHALQSANFTLVEQASFAHRTRHPARTQGPDDLAGFEVEQLPMFDPVAFLAAMIESKAVLDVPNVPSILINMIRQALTPITPLVPGA